MTTELRVALIGYGLAGQIFHAPFIEAVDGLSISAIVTSNPQRQALARERHPLARVFSSTEELYANDDLFDTVTVVTTNDAHAQRGIEALRHGKPVVVDKPFGRTAAEARGIAEAAEETGVIASCYHNRRWDSDYLTLTRLIDGGELGEIVRFESRLDRWEPVVGTNWRDTGGAELAAGMMYDLGAHLVDQALQLFGPPAAVYGERRARRTGASTDDDFFIAIEHADGVTSHLGASLQTALRTPRYRVTGASGSYLKYGADVQATQLRAGMLPRTPGFGRVPVEDDGTVGTDAACRVEATLPGDYARFYELFRDAVLGRGPVPVEPESAVAVIEVIEAARDSAASRAH